MQHPTSRIRQHPERSVPDELEAVLNAGRIAHVGFCQEGQPYVIPMGYYVEPGNPTAIYLHGSHGSRMLRHLTSDVPVCIEVTMMDGLVYSRSAKYHSINYRSVVGFGLGEVVADLQEKNRILEGMIATWFPGRTVGVDYQAAPLEHLQGTLLVKVVLSEWSVKAREGGPRGPFDQDDGALGNCGVIQFERPEAS